MWVQETDTENVNPQSRYRGGEIGKRRAMAWEYGDRSVESRHSEGREEIQPKPCKMQILAHGIYLIN